MVLCVITAYYAANKCCVACYSCMNVDDNRLLIAACDRIAAATIGGNDVHDMMLISCYLVVIGALL